MTLNLRGHKRGMIQMFDKDGQAVPCTVIHAEPNVVTQIKTEATDGYNAVQLAYEQCGGKDKRWKHRRVTKPRSGHFAKAGTSDRRHIHETRVDSVEEFELSQEVGVSQFSEIAYVDVTARSKGKGFQGVMKLHNFSGGPAAHGSGFHRHAGSTGMRSTPGYCFRGSPRPSHMGNNRVTAEGLEVILVDEEKNVIVVKGSVPGPSGALVTIRQSRKKTAAKK